MKRTIIGLAVTGMLVYLIFYAVKWSLAPRHTTEQEVIVAYPHGVARSSTEAHAYSGVDTSGAASPRRFRQMLHDTNSHSRATTTKPVRLALLYQEKSESTSTSYVAILVNNPKPLRSHASFAHNLTRARMMSNGSLSLTADYSFVTIDDKTHRLPLEIESGAYVFVIMDTTIVGKAVAPWYIQE